MEYQVKAEYHSDEFDWTIYPGETYRDGDMEPDVLANLCSMGVLEPVGAVKPIPPIEKSKKRGRAKD